MNRDVNSKYWNEELETLPREELEKRQLEDLKEIVQFAYDHAPYYKRSFDEAGVSRRISKPFRIFRSFRSSIKRHNVIPRALGPSLGNLLRFPKRMWCLSPRPPAPQEFLL